MLGALSRFRILDLSRVLAGPSCTQLLADLGADVIKIERPEVGDDTRGWGPPYLKNAAGDDTSEAGYYLSANRGKRSVAVDIQSTEGQDIIRGLALRSDVFVENFKVGGLQKYGLDYASLKVGHPELIYCSITGFGQTGPDASRAGYDFMIQGTGGLMSITGERDGVPGAGPQKVGVAMADLVTGLYAASAIQAALLSRESSGKGQYIDMALLDCQVAVLANQAMNCLISGQVPIRSGNAHPNVVPYQVFESSDGHIIIAIGNDSQFQRFCELTGEPALITDERFSTNAGRVRYRGELLPTIEKVIRQRSSADWADNFDAVGIPWGPINTIDKVLELPQVRHRHMRVPMDHPLSEDFEAVGSPLKLTDTPPRYDRPPPLLGEHTVEVLEDLLGYDSERIDGLRRQGVI
jgi:formyl-CoA transferase